MKYANTYKFRLVPPNLNFDSKKENEWKEFVEYLDNYKNVSKKKTENDKLKDSEKDWWRENNFDINEPISEVMKVQKWSRFIEGDFPEQEKEPQIYNNKEKETKKQKLVLEDDSSSYVNSESDETRFNIINYNLEKNNIYSNNSRYAKNVITEKQHYNYSSTSRNYKNKKNLENSNNYTSAKNIPTNRNEDSIVYYEKKHIENVHKQQCSQKKDAVEQENGTINLDNFQTIFNSNSDDNVTIIKNVGNTSKKNKRDSESITGAIASNKIFDTHDERRRSEYNSDKEYMKYDICNDRQNTKINKNSNNEHAHSKKQKQRTIPPFVIPRKIDSHTKLPSPKQNHIKLGTTNKNRESEASENSTNNSVEKLSHSRMENSEKMKYNFSYNNIQKINKRKRENIKNSTPQIKENNQKTKKNNLKKKDYSIKNKKNASSSRQIKKKSNSNKLEIDGSYAYNYAYLDSSSDQNISQDSNGTENSENISMLTNLQEEMAKYSFQKFA